METHNPNHNHNKEQDRRLENIEGSVKIINHELGEVRDNVNGVKIEMEKIRTEITGKIGDFKTETVTKIGELIKSIAEIKVSKKDSFYAILTPIMTALIVGLSVYFITN